MSHDSIHIKHPGWANPWRRKVDWGPVGGHKEEWGQAFLMGRCRVLNSVVVMDTRLCEYTKNHCLTLFMVTCRLHTSYLQKEAAQAVLLCGVGPCTPRLPAPPHSPRLRPALGGVFPPLRRSHCGSLTRPRGTFRLWDIRDTDKTPRVQGSPPDAPSHTEDEKTRNARPLLLGPRTPRRS